MTIPAAGCAAEPPDRRPGWIALTASERGASHVAVKTPNQDAVDVEAIGTSGLVAAVADGHGHTRHLRSARGSKLAVEIGCQVSQEIADLLEPGDTDSAEVPGSSPGRHRTAGKRLAELAEELLVPEIVSRWRAAVLDDVASDPFYRGRAGTAAQGRRRDDRLRLDAAAVHRAARLAGPGPDRRRRRHRRADRRHPGAAGPDRPRARRAGDDQPVRQEPDRRLPGRGGQHRADSAARLMLATDGYGNAQMLEEWPTSFSKDMAWLLRERDTAWIETQLPTWAARCASADGSADDTTVALLISPAGQAARPITPPGSFGSAATAPRTTVIPTRSRSRRRSGPIRSQAERSRSGVPSRGTGIRRSDDS